METVVDESDLSDNNTRPPPLLSPHDLESLVILLFFTGLEG